MINTICICGAGTMGSGIAQVCARSGFATILYDFNESILVKAKASIENNIQYLVDKEKYPIRKKQASILEYILPMIYKSCKGRSYN